MNNNLMISCDGLCKQRKYLEDLNILILGKDKRNLDIKLFICKDCLIQARQVTLNDILVF